MRKASWICVAAVVNLLLWVFLIWVFARFFNWVGAL